MLSFSPNAKLLKLVCVILLGACSFTYSLAQDTTTYEEQRKSILAPRAISAIGTDLFGDNVNLYNGSLTFTQTDVSLPGNNALAVMVGRRIATGENSYDQRGRHLAGGNLIFRIYTAHFLKKMDGKLGTSVIPGAPSSDLLLTRLV
jgi:hypothetical protein